MVDQIIGCLHEEGIDYPIGAPCPRCADLRHYLDDDGNLPDMHPRALNLALHQGAIVEWMTILRAPRSQVS